MGNTYNKVNLFIPCGMDLFSPAVPHEVVTLLEKLGNQVIYNPESTCCGRRFFFEGARDAAQAMGEKLMTEYDYNRQGPLIIPSTACVAYIKNNFRQLFENKVIHSDLTQFISQTFELCDYIVNIMGITCLENIFSGRVFYFKSCSAQNYYYSDHSPEILLRNTKGLDLLTDENLQSCCTANRNFAFHNPETSNEIIKDIVCHIFKTNCQYITSTDIHCLQYLDAYIQSIGGGAEVIPISSVLLGKE
jgi:L-lactate dehydrogenase complex protein LldE